jgi:hypothetical protein
MSMTPLQLHLISIGACAEGVNRALDYTPQKAWDVCRSPEWLFWWAGKTDVNSRETIIKAGVKFVGMVQEEYLHSQSEWPRDLLIVSQWCHQTPDEEDVPKRVAASQASLAVVATTKKVKELFGEAKAKQFEREACSLIRPLLQLPYIPYEGN